MFENIFQGSFATHTAEILIMWLVAGLIGLLTGYVLWHKYRRLCATLKEELAGLQLKLEQLETSVTQLKLQNAELDAKDARWQSQYRALLEEMDKQPPPPAEDATLSILEAMADDLTAIEGIDAHVEDLLFGAGVYTFQDVANSNLDTLRQILKAAGAEHPSSNPALWRKQAFQLFHGRKAHYEGFAGLKIGRRQVGALNSL